MSIFYNYFKHSLFVCGVIFFQNITFAFQGEPKYFEPVKDEFYIRPQLTLRGTSFAFLDIERKSSKSVYRLPSAKTFGANFYFFDIGFGLNFQIPNTAIDRGGFDFQTSLNTNRIGFDLLVQRQDVLFNNENPLQVNTRNFTVNTYYAFNHRRFSVSAPVSNTTRQERSAGSFLLNMLIARYSAESDGPLLSTEVRSNYDLVADMDGFRNLMWSIMPGYSYTYVRKPFNISGLASLGPAHNWHEYYLPQDNIRSLNFGLVSHLRLMLGYSKNRFFSGAMYHWYGARNNDEFSSFQWGHQFVRIYVGWYFIEKGFLKHSYTDIFSKFRQ